MIQVAHSKIENIRELTKKEKFLGLNFSSWLVSLFLCVPMINFTLFYAFILFLILMAFFYIAEFFDEDITDIILASFKIKGIGTYYA